MNENGKQTVLSKGIWIREQQGQLIIGSMDETDPAIMVVPDELKARLIAMESDMVDALFGKDRMPFQPGVLNLSQLLADLEKNHADHNLRVSFSQTRGCVFKADYADIYGLLEKLVRSSLVSATDTREPPLLYIHASLLPDHLCIIYRDSPSVSNPDSLQKEFEWIRSTLKGEISYKQTSGNRSYYDIIIPSK